MLIGAVAEATGLTARTVRFYERRGLLPEPQRAPNGYRTYDHTTLARLQFIRAAQSAGLTLAEIAGVLDTRDRGSSPCAHVEALLTEKLREVRERKRQLAQLERELCGLVDRGRQLDPADCTDTDICHIISSGRPSAPGPEG